MWLTYIRLAVVCESKQMGQAKTKEKIFKFKRKR